MSVYLFVLISCGCLCHGLQIREYLPARPKYMSAVARAYFFMEECLVTFQMEVIGREEHMMKFNYMKINDFLIPDIEYKKSKGGKKIIAQ